MDGATLLERCQSIVLWDNVFAITQYRPSTALHIAQEMFNWVDNAKFERYNGFSMDLFFEVAHLIDKLSCGVRGPAVIGISDVFRHFSKINPSKVAAVLASLSHKKDFNDGYGAVTDVKMNNYFSKPFIQLDGNRLLVPFRSWAAPNYFEALAGLCRKFEAKLDEKLGLEFEFLVSENLTKTGMKVVCGSYVVGKVNGETDLLVETDKAVIVIECKKKNLTRVSKSGDVENLLMDLTDSLFSAHFQTGKVEVLLRQESYIVFSNNGNPTKVSLNGREIIRIALTLSDYGGFHDRIIMGNFLEALSTHSFSSSNKDGAVQKRFADLEKKRKKWVGQIEELKKVDAYIETYPFRQAMFLNMAQLMEILGKSDSGNSFFQNLIADRHITYGTMDFYKESELVEELKGAG